MSESDGLDNDDAACQMERPGTIARMGTDWDDEHRGIHIYRRHKRDGAEYYCVIYAHSGHRELTAETPGALHAKIDVELAREHLHGAE